MVATTCLGDHPLSVSLPVFLLSRYRLCRFVIYVPPLHTAHIFMGDHQPDHTIFFNSKSKRSHIYHVFIKNAEIVFSYLMAVLSISTVTYSSDQHTLHKLIKS